MKPLFVLSAVIGSSLAISAYAADELANPDEIKPIKEFNPPKPITPNIAQSYRVENQFDRTDRTQYFSVTDKIDNAMRPVKLASGVFGKSFYNSLFANFRTANYYGIVNLNHTNANSYKDGKGNRVDFGYERFNQAVILGYVPTEKQEYRLTFIHDNLDDDKQPHNQSDAVKTERYISKLNARWGLEDLSNTVSAEVGYRHIERKADNFTLRSSSPNVFVEMERDILDLSLKYDVDFGKFHNTLGASYQNDHHYGERYAHTALRDFLNGYRFGGIESDRYRFFNTLSYKFNDAHQLGLGLTYEYLDSKVAQANANIPNPTNAALRFANPTQLWKYYYGYDFGGKVDSDAFSAELKYDFTPNEEQKYSVSLAHIERIGDNVERFNSLAAVVRNSMTGALMDQNPTAAIVGNPHLKNEEHNYVKLTADFTDAFYKGYLNSIAGDGLNIGGAVMYDNVKNLIIFDRARNQSGTVRNTNGVITRNVDATLISANLYANYNFLKNWAVGAKASYNYGQNRTDDRPLYQIRPFEFTANLDYKNYASFGSYNLGVATRFVAKQHRGDFDIRTGLGLDSKEAAKSVFLTDIYAGLNFNDKYGVRLGVNNLFDKHYAEFISGDHVMALTPNLVYAPGRTYWASLHIAF